MIGFKGESTFSLILVFGLLILVILVWLWHELIDKPEEKRKNLAELEDLKGDFQLLNSGKNLITYIQNLGMKVVPCKKCSLVDFTVWDIQPTLIIVRCNYCKKKYSYSDSELSDGFVQSLIKTHNSYLKLLELVNPLLDEYKVVPFNFSSLRKNQPVYQAYQFEASGILITAKEEKELSNRGNRRISRNVQDRVWRRDEGKCVICGSNEKLEFDHIIPYSKGGSNSYRNIQLLCESCNRAKSNNIG